MSPYVLRNWSTTRRYSRSRGEVREHLTGEVYAHPTKRDGTVVTTSAVVFRREDLAVTKSGSRYRLEGPGCKAPEDAAHSADSAASNK